MSKRLPYFRWFPADAEGDDFYMSLSREEFWLYHRCLNRSWMNDGIPSDLDELARIFRITRKQLDKWWTKVGQKWMQSPRDPLKLVDRRQEEEHEHVIKMGEANRRPGNANAAKGKRVENADETRARFPRESDGAQRASARAESEFVSDSKSLSFPSVAEFPETAIAIRENFRSAPDPLIIEVVHLSMQAYADVVSNTPGMPNLNDSLISEAVREAHFPKQENPYAYKTTVPRVVRTWAEEALREKRTQ